MKTHLMVFFLSTKWMRHSRWFIRFLFGCDFHWNRFNCQREISTPHQTFSFAWLSSLMTISRWLFVFRLLHAARYGWMKDTSVFLRCSCIPFRHRNDPNFWPAATIFSTEWNVAKNLKHKSNWKMKMRGTQTHERRMVCRLSLGHSK